MIAADAWYSAFRRLTLDRAGKARTAVLCGPHFITYNEFMDMMFRDVASLFRCSRVADIGMGHCGFFSVRNNFT